MLRSCFLVTCWSKMSPCSTSKTKVRLGRQGGENWVSVLQTQIKVVSPCTQETHTLNSHLSLTTPLLSPSCWAPAGLTVPAQTVNSTQLSHPVSKPYGQAQSGYEQTVCSPNLRICRQIQKLSHVRLNCPASVFVYCNIKIKYYIKHKNNCWVQT